MNSILRKYYSVLTKASSKKTLTNTNEFVEFMNIFPRKKQVQRTLFELDSNLTYKQLLPVFQHIYLNNKDLSIIKERNIQNEDLMIMKKVLERIRFKNKSVNKKIINLEDNLLNLAAEHGNNDAISILSFRTIINQEKGKNTTNTNEVKIAKDLIKQLFELSHPLTFKLTADMMYNSNNFQDASKYYKQFLKLEADKSSSIGDESGNSILEAEVYTKLGQISMKLSDLNDAERYFIKAIQLAPIEYTCNSYYYLSQIYLNSNPLKSRSLLEACSSQGFKESFPQLGYLELNYFKNIKRAKFWFELGMRIFQAECYFGYFNCCIKLNDYENASNCYNSLQILYNSVSENDKQLIDLFIENKRNVLKNYILQRLN
ncbi:hypothetical protein TBLA_0B09340 [Henningerozyma blattae CBS 6284]|uniref:Uncharacterized protein n=1 Tax=Henningerozyma blattae (strain ATCC 34711 / CBS 6284 / DSM 70876 / NBRC 10599 / NRRL Y-10934 / UCD 77-7) TaxID=1071380 RepID=I2H049_HENB6|nr:hypothetical protein TBLA_0B09340 [Tetrapisispora blattae CBS 6284]CCH59751.1 hypothetical protein TBLA_0B09340 [Tetrapisispora blattae CBS 6284]